MRYLIFCELSRSQKEKLFKLSRDLDKADVHELLANRKDDCQESSDNQSEEDECKENI